jgi:hypothetical protein
MPHKLGLAMLALSFRSDSLTNDREKEPTPKPHPDWPEQFRGRRGAEFAVSSHPCVSVVAAAAPTNPLRMSVCPVASHTRTPARTGITAATAPQPRAPTPPRQGPIGPGADTEAAGDLSSVTPAGASSKGWVMRRRCPRNRNVRYVIAPNMT